MVIKHIGINTVNFNILLILQILIQHISVPLKWDELNN